MYSALSIRENSHIYKVYPVVNLHRNQNLCLIRRANRKIIKLIHNLRLKLIIIILKIVKILTKSTKTMQIIKNPAIT